MSAMTVELTCPGCGSSVDVYPDLLATKAECSICQHHTPVHFTTEHASGILKECPVCSRKDFYSQKDFNRKIGVFLFIVAAIASIFTYGISFIVLYLFDLLLFRKLSRVCICYNCQTNFRGVQNIQDIADFNHEMHDRIVYSGHDFHGKGLPH